MTSPQKPSINFQSKPPRTESSAEPSSPPKIAHVWEIEEWTRAERRIFWVISGVLWVLLVWTMNNDDSGYLGYLEVWGLIVDPDPLIGSGLLILALIGGGVAVGSLRWVKCKRVPCPHGVPGGITAGKCSRCIEQQKQQEAIRRAEKARRAQVREEARNLRDKEVRRLVDQKRRDYGKILELSPRAFEDLVSALFRKMDYEVEQTPYTNDGGRDAIARKGGEIYLIECKRYAKDTNVGRRDLQIFHSAIIDGAAAGGFFVTTGKFGETAGEFVQNKNIQLVDGQRLVEWMRRYMPYDSQEAEVFQVMCEDCGNVVERRLSRPEEIVRCARGHEVRSDWTDQKFIFNG